MPLGTRVGDAEAFALGIALGIAGGLRDHHSQVATVFGRIVHAFGHERGLQAATAQLRNRRGAAEQRYSFMYGEDSRGSRLAINFGEEAYTVLPRGSDRAKL